MEYRGKLNELDSRLRGDDRQKGSLTVWMIGIIPLLVTLMILFINAILLVDAKIRMQAAIDRGVYAGASYLSYVMDEVAKKNWQFRKAFLEAEKNLGPPSQDNKNWITAQVRDLNNTQTALYNDMIGLLGKGYKTANEIASDVTAKNLAGMPHLVVTGYQPEYGLPGEGMFGMENDCPGGGDCINQAWLSPAEIKKPPVGGSTYDPSDYETHDNLVNMYLVKNESFAALAAKVEVQYFPPLMAWFFNRTGNGFGLRAFAAAQPYGGSMKKFAFAGGDDVEQAASDSGKGLLYHPAFIPVRAIDGGVDVEH